MRIRTLALVAGLSVPSLASAQIAEFTLNDGVFRYFEGVGLNNPANRTGTGTGASSNFGFATGGATATSVTSDYLFQNWFWYRSAGDTREFALSNQTLGTQLTPNSAFLRYVEPIGNNATLNGTLTFEFTYTLNQISPTQAAVTINWNVTNNTQISQAASLFAYSDSDIALPTGSTANDDNGTYVVGSGVNYYRNDNMLADIANFFTMGADLRLNDRWQLGPFSGVGSPRAQLANATVEDLTNADSTGGAADNAAALQWQLTIPAGGSLGGRITKGYNYVVPAPGAMALLGLGGLVAGRRRR